MERGKQIVQGCQHRCPRGYRHVRFVCDTGKQSFSQANKVLIHQTSVNVPASPFTYVHTEQETANQRYILKRKFSGKIRALRISLIFFLSTAHTLEPGSPNYGKIEILYFPTGRLFPFSKHHLSARIWLIIAKHSYS